MTGAHVSPREGYTGKYAGQVKLGSATCLKEWERGCWCMAYQLPVPRVEGGEERGASPLAERARRYEAVPCGRDAHQVVGLQLVLVVLEALAVDHFHIHHLPLHALPNHLRPKCADHPLPVSPIFSILALLPRAAQGHRRRTSHVQAPHMQAAPAWTGQSAPSNQSSEPYSSTPAATAWPSCAESKPWLKAS